MSLGFEHSEILHEVKFLLHVSHIFESLIIFGHSEFLLKSFDFLGELIWGVYRNHEYFTLVLVRYYSNVIVTCLLLLSSILLIICGNVIHILPAGFDNTPISLLEFRFLILLANCESHFLELISRWNSLPERCQYGFAKIKRIILEVFRSVVFDKFGSLLGH